VTDGLLFARDRPIDGQIGEQDGYPFQDEDRSAEDSPGSPAASCAGDATHASGGSSFRELAQ
jgi:hypothetical protein